MSPRQQRLAELYKARATLDAKIRRMQGEQAYGDAPADVTILPPPPVPPDPTWRDIAHGNQRMLWTLVHTYRLHHITHSPGMPEDREEAA